MPIHLQDYLGMHPYLLWLFIIPLCWAAELVWPRKVFILWAPACVVGGVVAAVLPALWWLQLLLAVVAAVALHLWLRPRLFSA